MNDKKRSLYKVGCISFILCFVIFLLIMVGQFFYIYYDELINKNITTEIAQLLFLMAGTMVHLIFAISIITASAVFYKYLFKRYKISLHNALKKSWIIAVLLVLFTFVYSAFVVQYFNAKALSLLYDLRNKEPDKPLVRTYDLFKSMKESSPMLMTVSEQISAIDKLKREKEKTTVDS